MLYIKRIIENPKEVIENLNQRGNDFTEDIEVIVDNYKKYTEALQKEEEVKSFINKSSKLIGEYKREGKDSSELLKEIEDSKRSLSDIDSKKYKSLYEERLFNIPNLLADGTPLGKDDTENEEVKVWGEVPNFPFEAKNHYDIEEAKKDFHFDKAANISKSRFVITTNFLAKLERAIMNYMLDTHTSKGYSETAIPFIASANTLYNSGQLPKFKDDLFKIEKNTKSDKDEESLRDFYLIPTAEVVLANYHQSEILDESLLPLNYTAFSQCFRKEAGSAGRDTSGIIRMHQFGKVELFKYTTQETSYDELDNMVKDAEAILQGLKLPYRIVKLCTGDIGFGAATTYDLEVWMPGQNKYRECSSCSNVTDFQARRGQIKYKTKDGNKKYAHMLNGSGMATGRILAAVLENYQQEDGSIKVPEVLGKYM